MEVQPVENKPVEKKKYTYTKEKIQEYNKSFYQSHKEPIQCEICLQEYKYHNKYNHLKTKIHQVALKLKDINKV